MSATEIDLEIVFGWHVVSFLCILANGCQEVLCQVQMNPLGTSRNLEIKLDEIRSMDIFGDAQMLTYLQLGELDVGLTFKEKDRVLQKAKRYHWKGKHLLKIWQDGHVQVVPWPKMRNSTVRHSRRSWDIFGYIKPTICFKVNIGGKACSWRFNSLFHNA